MARKKVSRQSNLPEPVRSSFPIYLLILGNRLRVVFPEGKEDIDHWDFWEQSVAGLVADYHKVPVASLLNLPYCQRRARVSGPNVYYGGRAAPALLRSVRRALGDDILVFVHDDYEKRLEAEVLTFRRLVARR